MIYKYLKVRDTNESVLDLNEILKVELKNDNVQSFNTRWVETIIAMKKHSGDEVLDNMYIYIYIYIYITVSFNNRSS